MRDSPLVLILNGVNLNRLGTREPEIYGRATYDDLAALCTRTAETLGVRVDIRQTNHEGDFIDWIQEAAGAVDGIVINAAAWTHTSVAIHDALKLHAVPIVEVHISDPKTRESFRHTSFIEPLAARVIAGKGVDGYAQALHFLSGVFLSTSRMPRL